MLLIGREKEQQLLRKANDSFKPEFIVIYGRRRIGKTYLVDATFQGQFAFRISALPPLQKGKSAQSPLRRQLDHFYYTLLMHGMKRCKKPKSWAEAFYLLEAFLSEKNNERLVVFLDELPWFDTPKSDFITNFIGFWNNWACSRNITLIVSGSSIAWMTKNIFDDVGGLYGRPTLRMKLSAFSLKETELFFQRKGVNLSRYDIAQAQIFLGGVPYYLDQFQPGLSFAQNMDGIFFSENAPLQGEFNDLFPASFLRPSEVKNIVLALGGKREGLSRGDILKLLKKQDGGTFTDDLLALERADFICSFRRLGEKQTRYRLIDPFSKFAMLFQNEIPLKDPHYFSANLNSGTINALKGYGFENLCFNHLHQIKAALGISGVACETYSFSASNPASQIDMVIVRKDNIINLCEMKFTVDPYSLSKAEDQSLQTKIKAISSLSPLSSAIHPVLVTTYDPGDSLYRNSFERIITLDDLFS